MFVFVSPFPTLVGSPLLGLRIYFPVLLHKCNFSDLRFLASVVNEIRNCHRVLKYDTPRGAYGEYELRYWSPKFVTWVLHSCEAIWNLAWKKKNETVGCDEIFNEVPRKEERFDTWGCGRRKKILLERALTCGVKLDNISTYVVFVVYVLD